MITATSNPLATRRLRLACPLASALFLAAPAWSQTDSWTGGTGTWFDPNDISNGCAGTKWSICPPPPAYNNNILITAPSSVVTVNNTAFVLDLTLGAGNSLLVTSTSELNFGNTDVAGTYALTLSNSGQIVLADQSSMNIGSDNSGPTTLTITGSGTLTLDNFNNRIAASALNATLINQSAIQGQGAIGIGTLALNNQGTISANVAGGTLTIQPNSAGMSNSGTLSATGGGILDLENGDTTFDNTGGRISAAAGSTVIMGAGTYLGGTLQTTGSGVMETLGGGANPMLENLTNQGNYQILSAGSTTLDGTITNNGTLQLLSTGGGTYLFINGDVTLQGTGAVQLMDSASPNNFITGAGGQLDNLEDIAGAGAIGEGITIINQGTIRAIYADNPLTLDDDGFSNLGTVRAQNDATLNIFSPSFNNQGTLEVDAGSTIDFDDSYKLLNYNSATNTLSGGSYLVAGSLQFLNAANGIVAIDTNAANIVLNGAGSSILNAFGDDVLAGLSVNASAGSFTIENGRNFTTAGDFQNSGTLVVGNGSTFTTGAGAANSYTQSGASSLTDIQGGGQLDAATYTQNAGTTRIDADGTLTTATFNFNGGALVVNGNLDPLSLDVCAHCTLEGLGTVTADVISDGTVAPGSSPTAPGTLSIHGDYQQDPGAELLIELAATGAGHFGVLDVSGDAELAGTLEFEAIDGFVPTKGDDFTFLLFGSESDAFSSTLFEDGACPIGDTCKTVFGPGMLSLDITGSSSGPPTVPEPPSAWLLAIAGACLARLRYDVRADRQQRVRQQSE
jgi:hypothetical protein